MSGRASFTCSTPHPIGELEVLAVERLPGGALKLTLRTSRGHLAIWPVPFEFSGLRVGDVLEAMPMHGWRSLRPWAPSPWADDE